MHTDGFFLLAEPVVRPQFSFSIGGEDYRTGPQTSPQVRHAAEPSEYKRLETADEWSRLIELRGRITPECCGGSHKMKKDNGFK